MSEQTIDHEYVIESMLLRITDQTAGMAKLIGEYAALDKSQVHPVAQALIASHATMAQSMQTTLRSLMALMEKEGLL